MRKVILVAVTVALTFACGSSGGGGAPLDPNFLGSWSGKSQLAVTNVATYTAVPATVNILTVSGNTATVLNCLAATQTYTGSGDTASWSGSTTCPPTGEGTCGQFTVTAMSSNIALSGGVLTIVNMGTAAYGGSGSYCGKTYAYTREFSGGVKDAGP